VQTNNWSTFEEVARFILSDLASEFGLGRVEGKQVVPGSTGTSWELDAKGVCIDGDGIVLIECRRYPSSRIKQKDMASIAFQISDIGAAGGITVSPLPPQRGAKIIAAQNKITHVELSPSCTSTDYIVSFLGNIFIKFTEKIQIGAFFDAEAISKKDK
jgi:hypothetical protein